MCAPQVGGKVRLLAALLVLAGIVNNIGSLGWGFFYDDFVHQYVLRHREADSTLRPWSLYDFGARPGPGHPAHTRGFAPWWTSPDFRIRFFRPVTSATIYLDYLLYDDWAPGYHLTSLVLFGVFLGLSFKLYRDLGVPSTAALWALALLAFEDNNTLPVGWTANRNTLLAGLFTVATLLAVHHYRRTSKWRYLFTAVVSFGLALGSKESGLIVVILIGLYLLLLDARRGNTPSGAAHHRLLRSGTLWLFVGLGTAYLVFYLTAGYGTRCTLYCAPWRDVGGYAYRLLVLIPLSGVSLLFGTSADLAASLPHMTWILVGAAIPVVLVAGRIVLRTVGWTPLTGFAVAWLFCSLLPEAGAEPSDRLFMNASVGYAMVIGLFFHRLGSPRQWLTQRQYVRGGFASILFLTGVVISIPMTTLRGRFIAYKLAGVDREIIANAEIDRTGSAPAEVFLLNSPSSLLALTFLPTWSVVHDDYDSHISNLQMGRRAITWTRENSNTMTLTCDGTPFGDHRYERLFVGDRMPQAGSVAYETAAFAAVPLEVEPTGVRTVLLRFHKSLDHPSYQFLAWRDGRLARIEVPAIGETIELAKIDAPLRMTP